MKSTFTLWLCHIKEQNNWLLKFLLCLFYLYPSNIESRFPGYHFPSIPETHPIPQSSFRNSAKYHTKLLKATIYRERGKKKRLSKCWLLGKSNSSRFCNPSQAKYQKYFLQSASVSCRILKQDIHIEYLDKWLVFS